MSATQHAFEVLESLPEAIPPVIVLFGDAPFLKQQVRRRLIRRLIAQEDTPYDRLEGETAEWRDVSDALSTRSLFASSGARVVLVESADTFVTTHRERLEAYVEKPKSSSHLILEVNKWAANSRLYKRLAKSGLQVECRAPRKAGRSTGTDESRVSTWLIAWSKSQYDAQLSKAAAKRLLELAGLNFGLLDQELAKLSLFAEPGGKVTPKMVDEIIGGWKAQTVWQMADAAADGKADEALLQLDHLLQSGDHPVALLAQISWALRRFAVATRYYEAAERDGKRIRLADALEKAGFQPWALARAQQQLRRLGRQRSGEIFRWLLEADLALKGSHSTAHRGRLLLEQLIMRLAVPR